MRKKAKKNEYVYAILAESMFDEGSNWSYYRKLNMLILATTLIRPVNTMELKYITTTTTTTVSPYVTLFNDMKTSLEYEHFILIVLFIHHVLASLILRKVH